MRTRYLRWKCRRNRWLVEVLRRWCRSYRCITEATHHPHPQGWADHSLPLSVSFTYLIHRFRFGKKPGASITVELSGVIVTQQRLGSQMTMQIDQVDYVGLSQPQLMRLLADDYPWLQ